MMAENRPLPDNFFEDMILKAPSKNIMNKMARAILALYSYDDILRTVLLSMNATLSLYL